MASQAAIILEEIRNSLEEHGNWELMSPAGMASTFSIPVASSLLQHKHQNLLQDFETLKRYIETNLRVVEKTELIMNIISYKMYEIVHNFRSIIDELKKRRDKTTKTPITRLNETELALTIVQIDKEIGVQEEKNQKDVEALKLQKIETQLEYERAVATLDSTLDMMKKGYNNLLLLIEVQQANATESEINIMEHKYTTDMENLKKTIKEFSSLKDKGWRELYPEEKTSQLLDKRGLKVTRSGNLFTSSGHRLTIFEARRSKLLEGLDLPWGDIFGHKMESRSASEPASQSGSSVQSKSSKMSSEDVNYLKDKVGKALTLAIAEITAVRPRDPIHYLGHWLFKYRYNQEKKECEEIELQALTEERDKVAKERWHKFLEAEARQVVLEMIMNAEQQAALNELKRLQELEAQEEEHLDNDPETPVSNNN